MTANKSTTRQPGDFIIAGKKRVSHWRAFRGTLIVGAAPALWAKAYKDYFYARLSYRYLKPLKTLQTNGPIRGEGFSIVAIQCSLIEFLPCSLRARVRRREGDERQALPPVVRGVGPR